jgi:nucleoside-diphosphate-sugar epimerase
LTDGLQQRDHLHVADVASAVATLAVGQASGVVNVCSGQPVTLRHVIETAARFVGRPDLLRFGARARSADEVAFLVGDASRLRGLGWVPSFDLDEGIRDAVEAVRSRWIAQAR